LRHGAWLTGPYLDGLSLSMHQGRSREYISAVVCAWIGAFIPSLCAGMAVIWLYCALVAAPVRETFLITGMYGLIAVLFVGLPMVYQVRKIAERVIVPWLARSRPGSGSGDEPGDAFRVMKTLCYLWLPIGMSLGLCILCGAAMVMRWLG